jgi:murein DD-endopeptidase MepM/ murein hydrolase activator NlpD
LIKTYFLLAQKKILEPATLAISISLFLVACSIYFTYIFLVPPSVRLYWQLSQNWGGTSLAQSLKFPPLRITTYQLETGDTLWDLSRKLGMNIDTLVSFNEIKKAHTLQLGQVIKLPHLDGLLYEVRSNDTLDGIASNHSVTKESIVFYNQLDSEQSLRTNLSFGKKIFLPGAIYSFDERMERFGSELYGPMPAGSYRITALYGWRIHPITRGRDFHRGVDLGAGIGTTVYSAQAGVVIMATVDFGYGQFIAIQHKKGYVSRYAHLSRMFVHVGQIVGVQSPIGAVGMTGRTTGPHLHFEVLKDGEFIDPRTVTAFR